MIVDSKVVTRSKRALWQSRANVERYAERTSDAHSGQRLLTHVQTDIVRRFMRGRRLLDVGIGTGRVSAALMQDPDLVLTGVDASPAMIEWCAKDTRLHAARLLKGDLERLQCADAEFDTVISVDTFAHLPNWAANLDELVRVTRPGGRVIVDLGSQEHVEAVAHQRGSTVSQVQAPELRAADGYILRLSRAELRAYAAQRKLTLLALVPYGAILGGCVTNYWIDESYAVRSGAIDRLVSWIGADPLLYAFAEFIERRIVQALPPAVSGRMFAVFECAAGAPSHREPFDLSPAELDERGPLAWHAEFESHVVHEPNRAFAVAFLLAGWPLRLPQRLRAVLPAALLHELERTERAAHIDDICHDVVAAWRSRVKTVEFHGVDLADTLGILMHGELRTRLETSE